MPVLANLDVGHTHPLATIPIGGLAELAVGDGEASLVLCRH
ncbi:hypothetical protein ACFQQB_60710 [Nonomuraea rubra]